MLGDIYAKVRLKIGIFIHNIVGIMKGDCDKVMSVKMKSYYQLCNVEYPSQVSLKALQVGER